MTLLLTLPARQTVLPTFNFLTGLARSTPPTRCLCRRMLFAPQLQLGREWAQKGEPTLAAFAFQKALKAFKREKEVKRFQFRGAIRYNQPRLWHNLRA